MPRAATPRSAGNARKKADPLQRKPEVVIHAMSSKGSSTPQPVKPKAKRHQEVLSAREKKWVESPSVTRPAPDFDNPWRHPAELQYITPDWSDDLIIDFLIRHGFSIPPRPRASKDPWTKITSWDGQTVTTIPRLYRLPLMFAAKFQWQSLRLVMSSGNREKEWNEYKFDILHVSRLCTLFLEEARRAQTEMLLSKEWKCHTFDRAIIRYYQRWMLSRDEYVKEFWYEFDEDEYRKNVFEFNWHKFVLEGHRGFNISKEEILEGLSFEDLTEGCGFVDGRLKWGTSSNTASTTNGGDLLKDASILPSTNGTSADPIGHLRPRNPKMLLKVKKEVLDDMSISSGSSSSSSSLSPAPSSPGDERSHRLPRKPRGVSDSSGSAFEADMDVLRVYKELTGQSTHPKSPDRPSTTSTPPPTKNSTTIAPKPVNGTSAIVSTAIHSTTNGVSANVQLSEPILPTPPPSAPSAPPILSRASKSPKGDTAPPSPQLPRAIIPLRSLPPVRPSPLTVQTTTTNGTADPPAQSPSLPPSAKTPIRSSWDARIKATLERTRLATTKDSDQSNSNSNTSSTPTPGNTPSDTPIIALPALPPQLRRMTPVTEGTSPPPVSATMASTPTTTTSITIPAAMTAATPERTSQPPVEMDLPPEYDEKELLKSYFQIPDSIVGTPVPLEVPSSNDLADSGITEARGGTNGIGRKRKLSEAEEEKETNVLPKPSPRERTPTPPSSFSISSSRESSTEAAPPPPPIPASPVSKKMDISPSSSARISPVEPPSRPRSANNSMDVDNPLTDRVTTVLKHTLEGLTDLMNTVHQQGHGSKPPDPSSSQAPAAVPAQPSLADLMGEIRSLKEAIQEDSQHKVTRDTEMRQLKTEVEELRRMLVHDGMSVDSEPSGSTPHMIPSPFASHSTSFYRRSPSVMTPISAHPLSHLVHADEDDRDQMDGGGSNGVHPLSQRTASGSTVGGAESASMVMARPTKRLSHSMSPAKSFHSDIPDNVPLKLKKKHMIFQKPPPE